MPYEKISIVSIQHTGTKLLVSKFTQDELALKDPLPGLHVGHISAGQMPHIRELYNYPMIIPQRHPYLVYESWVRREKPISDLMENYGYLINEIDKYNPYYVNIDLSIKNDQIDKINTDIGLTLSKNWPIINSKTGTYDLNPEEIHPPTSFIEMVERNKEFFKLYCRETEGSVNGANH